MRDRDWSRRAVAGRLMSCLRPCGGFDLRRSRFQFLDVLVRQLDGADERLALAEAVAIGAAGHQQMELVGQLQVMLGGRRSNASCENIRCRPGRPRPAGNDLVGAVQPRMRHAPPARRPDESSQWPSQRGHLDLGHPRRPVPLQETLEGLVQARDTARPSPARAPRAAGPAICSWPAQKPLRPDSGTFSSLSRATISRMRFWRTAWNLAISVSNVWFCVSRK